MSRRKPYVVVYREPKLGECMERFATPQEASTRLNELWGPPGPHGPSRHPEARAVLYTHLRMFRA